MITCLDWRQADDRRWSASVVFPGSNGTETEHRGDALVPVVSLGRPQMVASAVEVRR
jgi:hypothetical protein